jgi:acetyl esterase/lipase
MTAMKRSEHLLSRSAVRVRIHHRHSAQSVAVSLASRLLVKNAVRVWSVQPNRNWGLEHVDSLAGLLPRTGSMAQIRRVRLDRCNAEWVRAPGVSSTRAILYFHGGAFLTCGLNTHRALVTRLSKTANAAVLSVGYRKLPSHGISDATDDGISGLRWLLDRGYDDENIVVAGDSAGGYLAFMTTLSAVAGQIANPAGIAAISPFTDADPAPKLRHRNARRCSMFTGGALSMFARYLGETVSPVDADLSALPPVAIHASSDELLLPDAELMADRLASNGIRCDLHLWQGQIHDFPLAADILPEGRRALRYIGEFIKEVTPGHNEMANEASAAPAKQRAS